MKDFRGIEIKVGDTVAFVDTGQNPNLYEGEVKAVSLSNVTIEYEAYSNHIVTTTKRSPKKITVLRKVNLLKEIIKHVKTEKEDA